MAQLSDEAKQLYRWFNDNIFGGIRYIHHQGFGEAAQQLKRAGLIEEQGDLYIIASKKKTELSK
jgi:hypothetical protein